MRKGLLQANRLSFGKLGKRSSTDCLNFKLQIKILRVKIMIPDSRVFEESIHCGILRKPSIPSNPSAVSEEKKIEEGR